MSHRAAPHSLLPPPPRRAHAHPTRKQAQRLLEDRKKRSRLPGIAVVVVHGAAQGVHVRCRECQNRSLVPLANEAERLLAAGCPAAGLSTQYGRERHALHEVIHPARHTKCENAASGNRGPGAPANVITRIEKI